MRVCAGALVVFSLLLGLSTPSSAASASFNSATSSPPAPLLPPRLSYWDFNGRLQRLEDITFTKEDARKMEDERKKEMKEMALSGLLLITISAAILRQDTTARMDIMEAERKKEAKQLKVDMETKEAERKTEMKEMADTTQRNFKILFSHGLLPLYLARGQRRVHGHISPSAGMISLSVSLLSPVPAHLRAPRAGHDFSPLCVCTNDG
jgi:hypothetical protein